MKNINEINFEHKTSNLEHYIYAKLNNKKIGYAWFKIQSRNAILCYISVDAKYRHCHVGSAILDCIEVICRQNQVKNIEGKFFPEIDCNIVLDFYKKNDYFYYQDGYEHYISKYFYSKYTAPDIKIIEK